MQMTNVTFFVRMDRKKLSKKHLTDKCCASPVCALIHQCYPSITHASGDSDLKSIQVQAGNQTQNLFRAKETLPRRHTTLF